MPLKNWCSIHARWSKSSLKHSIRFCVIFSKFKTEFYCILSHSIFEIHQLWQSGFGRVYSNCCCSCSFEPEIIKIGLSSYKMYSNNILNLQESTTILNAHTKNVWKLIVCPSYISVRETEIQSQVEWYQKLKKWYLMLLRITLIIIGYGSRLWSNPRRGVALSSTHRCVSYFKGSLRIALDYGRTTY